MKCRLPMRISTPSGGGTSYPEGAFVPVTKFTDGRTYALVAKIDGVYRYINTTTYNDWTMNATEVAVTEKSGYVLFGSEPALFTAKASGDGFTLANGSNFLYGTSSGGTALRVGTTSAVWKVDTSETGGFASGKYLPKEVSSSVWLKNTANNYDWCIKYESGNKSFGYDRAGRDNTYSTGFVSFILYEKWEGQTGGGDSGGDSGGGGDSECALVIKAGSQSWPSGLVTITVNGTNYTSPTTLALVSGAEVSVKLPANTGTVSIWHNGTRVDNGASTARTYTFTLTEDTTISALEANNQVVITGSGSSGGGSSGNEVVVNVTESGKGGDATNCYVTINGNTVYEAVTVAVPAGSTIIFGVKGYSSTYPGVVRINGTKVLNATASRVYTYEWTIPDNTNQVDVILQNAQTGYGNSVITVTTS